METQGKTKLVAIVDDDDSMRRALQGLLQSAEFPAQSFASAEEFLKSGKQHQIACLIADIRMPGMSGLELQTKLNAERCRVPIILDRKSTRLNSSHLGISYAVFCLKKKNKKQQQ